MESDFAEYFKSDELADAELVITALCEQHQARKRQRTDTELARFPAHQLILRRSEFFKSQVQRWQQDSSVPTSTGRQTRGAAKKQAPPARPLLQLALDDAQQHEAAEAVIAAMYGVQGALDGLQQQDLVSAVIISDRIQALSVAERAGGALLAAAQQGLDAAALEALACLSAWPHCLVQLLPKIVQGSSCCGDVAADLTAFLADSSSGKVQNMLLAVLGDLDEVWADQQLQSVLLSLPLSAVQLLLASDHLRVTAEDTVLYTAQQYMEAQSRSSMRHAAQARLLQLVRCPQLSWFCLSANALATNPSQLLLGSLQPQLQQLLSLRRIATAAELLTADIRGAPESWQKGPRRLKLGSGEVQVVWRLPVDELIRACKECSEGKKTVYLWGPSSPPKGGLAWRCKIRCGWLQEGEQEGTRVSLYVRSVDHPEGGYYKYTFSLNYCNRQRKKRSPCLPSGTSRGWGDVFGVGVMAGGWDEAAWAAKGLPMSGEVELLLTIHDVC